MNLNALKTNQAATGRGEYVVVKGFNYGPDDARFEPGDSLKGVPADVIAELLESGAIQPKETEVK